MKIMLNLVSTALILVCVIPKFGLADAKTERDEEQLKWFREMSAELDVNDLPYYDTNIPIQAIRQSDGSTITVKSLDDPANPYAGQYGPWDAWGIEHELAVTA